MYSDSDAAFSSEEPDAEANLLQDEDREELIHAIAALPERLQLVIKLHFVEEFVSRWVRALFCKWRRSK